MRPGLTAAAWLFPILVANAGEHAAPLSVRELTHIHGVALPSGSDEVLLATHRGLFAVNPAGQAKMISAAADDFMGFTASRDGRLYASGHPGSGGNTGVISTAGLGEEWEHLSPGADGPVDFHAMSVSPADPQTIYGSYGGVQVSRDGGKTWSISGTGPAELIDLAAAQDDGAHVYAGTMTGLFESRDFGRTWTPMASVQGVPVSAVEVSPDGELHAFIPGAGLIALKDGKELAQVGQLDGVVLHMAFDHDEPGRLIAVTTESQVLSSTDGGKTWAPFAP